MSYTRQRVICFVFVWFLIPFLPGPGSAQDGNAHSTKYEIMAEISPGTRMASGEAVIRWRNDSSLHVKTIHFSFGNFAEVNHGDFSDFVANPVIKRNCDGNKGSEKMIISDSTFFFRMKSDRAPRPTSE